MKIRTAKTIYLVLKLNFAFNLELFYLNNPVIASRTIQHVPKNHANK